MNNNSIWKIRLSDGQMEFPTRRKLHKLRSKPDSYWNHPIVLLLVILTCASVDLFNFKQLFDAFLFDRPLSRMIGIAAFLISYDLIPVYLGMDYKKKHQGYKGADKKIADIMIAVFMLACIANVALRIVTKNMVLPNTADIFSGDIFGEVVDIETENSKTDLATVYAAFGSIVPVITSLASLSISYMMANPIYKEKMEHEKQQIIITTRINELKSLLKEYECNQDYLERLRKDDKERYQASLNEIEAHRLHLIDYTRERIKEFEANPTSTNILSKPHLKVVA